MSDKVEANNGENDLDGLLKKHAKYSNTDISMINVNISGVRLSFVSAGKVSIILSMIVVGLFIYSIFN